MEDTERPPPSLPTATRLANIGFLVDARSQPREEIKRLKQGDGTLARHIQVTVDGGREELGIDAAKEIVPVVLLYRCR